MALRSKAEAKTHSPWQVYRAKGQQTHQRTTCRNAYRPIMLCAHKAAGSWCTSSNAYACQHVRVPYFSSFQNQCTSNNETADFTLAQRSAPLWLLPLSVTCTAYYWCSLCSRQTHWHTSITIIWNTVGNFLFSSNSDPLWCCVSRSLHRTAVLTKCQRRSSTKPQKNTTRSKSRCRPPVHHIGTDLDHLVWHLTPSPLFTVTDQWPVRWLALMGNHFICDVCVEETVDANFLKVRWFCISLAL